MPLEVEVPLIVKTPPLAFTEPPPNVKPVRVPKPVMEYTLKVPPLLVTAPPDKLTIAPVLLRVVLLPMGYSTTRLFPRQISCCCH